MLNYWKFFLKICECFFDSSIHRCNYNNNNNNNNNIYIYIYYIIIIFSKHEFILEKYLLIFDRSNKNRHID